jgi:hypothetical protein
MANPAFIVEGHLEQDFIQNACPGSQVRRLECNGDSVAIAAISKRAASLIRLLEKRNAPIVVIFDRERRHETVLELELKLREALKVEGVVCDVAIGIPDRDIETWMLADHETLAQYLNQKIDPFECVDGVNGKGKLKQLFAPKNYSETLDGPILLKKCCSSRIKAVSTSFARLCDQLQNLDCWWLRAATQESFKM